MAAGVASSPAASGNAMRDVQPSDSLRTAFSKCSEVLLRDMQALVDAETEKLRRELVEKEASLRAQFEKERAELHAELQAELQAERARVDETRAELEAREAAFEEERVKLEGQKNMQAGIAKSFSELQGIVSQLVRRLSELDAQRLQLAEEKSMAENVVKTLRTELQKWRQAAGVRVGSGSQRGESHRADTGSCAPGRHRRCCRGCSCRGRPRSGTAAQTPPKRGACAKSGSVPRSRGSKVHPQAPLAQAGITSKDLQLAESRIQCALLRKQLEAEEQAASQVRSSHDAVLRESADAESKTAQLQSELKDMLANWSVRYSASDDEESVLIPGELGDGSSSGGHTAVSGDHAVAVHAAAAHAFTAASALAGGQCL